jgi:hypothetical protein
MKLSDKILVVAKWLESEDNELLVEADSNEDCMSALALSLVHAAETLRDVATEVAEFEPAAQSEITSESLDEMAAVAASFAESEDELLRKQANVLDEILLTLGGPKDYLFSFKKAEDAKLETLKKKYREPKEEIDEDSKVSEALDALKKSPMFKEYRPMEAPLSTRTCPDHPGAQMARIEEGTYQCALDHKTYNYDVGYTNLKGDKIPPGSISEQTPKFHEEGHTIFQNRDARLGIHRE